MIITIHFIRFKMDKYRHLQGLIQTTVVSPTSFFQTFTPAIRGKRISSSILPKKL